VTQKTRNFLELALDDYRAARLLIREGLLAQGVALASTAVEKELKAVLGLKGFYTKKHLDTGLLATANQHFPGFKDALDGDFIKFLGKGFDLRYASVDGPGYTIVINQHRTLVALDFTMLTIDSGITLRLNDEPHPTPLQQAVSSKDPLVLADNVALKTISQEDIFQRHNKMFELRVGKNLETLLAMYETEGLNIIGKFCKTTDMDFNKPQFYLARG
jgi:hypothetical protein